MASASGTPALIRFSRRRALARRWQTACDGARTGLRAVLQDAAEFLMSDAELNEAREIDAGLQQLSALTEACGDDRERFFEALPLATEADGWDPRADRVSLLTLHAATKKVLKQLRDAHAEVVATFREASARLLAGEVDVVFPEGTFPPGLPFVPFAIGARGHPI